LTFVIEEIATSSLITFGFAEGIEITIISISQSFTTVGITSLPPKT